MVSGNDLNAFNIRVYGIWIRNNEILLSTEKTGELEFTKFPGGGLHFGEGIGDCLKREFREELNIEIQPKDLFYVNENLVASAFHKNQQLISIYYLVDSTENPPLLPITEHRWGKDYHVQAMWVQLQNFHAELLYFPIDKIVAEMLKNRLNPG
ncbi:MAG: NUDIX domain-containing protein [Bacteroidetes bacterium]|nr:NUDIX domain-containing protein [Bacteroidota bacterium]